MDSGLSSTVIRSMTQHLRGYFSGKTGARAGTGSRPEMGGLTFSQRTVRPGPPGVDDLVHVHLGGDPGRSRAAAKQYPAAPDFPAPQVRRDGVDTYLVHDAHLCFRRVV